MATTSTNNNSEEIDFYVLPEGCIANALSLTSPRDACRLSLIATTFRSAAESDAVWERFLPSDYQDILNGSVDITSIPVFGSKKELYLYLCDHPILIHGGTKSFSLDKWTGKKCYMIAARDLSIIWGDTPMYWRWTSLPESRFLEVAELLDVCWLEIHGKINTSFLSPDTTYSAYLVFKSTVDTRGFEYRPAEVSVRINGSESETHTAYLDPDGGQRQRSQILPRRIGLFNRYRFANVSRQQADVSEENNSQYPKQRADGWTEIKLGEYVNRRGQDGELVMSLTEVKGGNWKSGLIVQGMEIRPKEG